MPLFTKKSGSGKKPKFDPSQFKKGSDTSTSASKASGSASASESGLAAWANKKAGPKGKAKKSSDSSSHDDDL